MAIYILLYVVFIAIASGMLIWALLEKDRVFQYPAIAGTSWLAYFGVQAFGAIQNPHKYPQAVLDDGGLIIALVMLCLCSGAGWLGYYHAGLSRRILRFRKLSGQRLFWGGVILYGIGFLGAYKLAQLTGGFAQQFTGGGHYSLEWAGAPVRYVFFSQLTYPGLLLVLISTLRRFSWGKLLVCGLFVLYPLAVAVFLGRRSSAGMLAGIILLSLYFTKRIQIPRILCVIVPIAAFLVIYYGPAYRSISQYGLHYDEIVNSVAKADVGAVWKGQKYTEFDVMVVWGAATNRSLAFGYGADIYNNLVSFYVPRQLVGEEIKRSLMIQGIPDQAKAAVARVYNWGPDYGSFLTGPYTAFSQFWFFGCLLYYVFGYVFRLLWQAAYERRNLAAQIWYISCIVLIPMSIMSSIIAIPAQLVYIVAFMWFIGKSCSSPLHQRLGMTKSITSPMGGPRAKRSPQIPSMERTVLESR